MAPELLRQPIPGELLVFPEDSVGALMQDDCPECNILSANLSEASKAYFATLEKRQLAQTENNTAMLFLLEALMVAAAEKRGKARQELRQHRATHPKTKARTA